jgi:hypothetical protein
MLRAVQTVTIAGELRTISFRTLTVEQIGYVYEGLLSFEGFRAAETVVGLIGKDGREEEVPLRELESTAAAHVSAGTFGCGPFGGQEMIWLVARTWMWPLPSASASAGACRQGCTAALRCRRVAGIAGVSRR